MVVVDIQKDDVYSTFVLRPYHSEEKKSNEGNWHVCDPTELRAL